VNAIPRVPEVDIPAQRKRRKSRKMRKNYIVTIEPPRKAKGRSPRQFFSKQMRADRHPSYVRGDLERLMWLHPTSTRRTAVNKSAIVDTALAMTLEELDEFLKDLEV
jgi:hypothetical protein